MYAVIRDRSKQYKVQKGDTFAIDYRDGIEEGAEIVFDQVLYVGGDAKKISVGKPTVSNAKVIAQVKNPLQKGAKLKIFMWKRRKNSQRHLGHRQKFTTVQITDIKV